MTFDIDNEDTWAEGLIPVAKFFYNFTEDLVNKGLIDSAELESLKLKNTQRSYSKPRIIQQLQIAERIIWEILFKRDTELNPLILMALKFMYQHSFLTQIEMP